MAFAVPVQRIQGHNRGGDWNGDGIDEVGVYREATTAEMQTASAADSSAATR